MTPSPHTPRKINLSSALANEIDEYGENARASFEGATDDRINRDILELEALARTIIGHAINGETLIKRTEFAQVPASKYSTASLIVDAYESKLTPAAHAVLAAQVRLMEEVK